MGTPPLDSYYDTKFSQPQNFDPVDLVSDLLVPLAHSECPAVYLGCQRGRNAPQCHQCHHVPHLPDGLHRPNIVKSMYTESANCNPYSSAAAIKKRKRRKVEFGWHGMWQLTLFKISSWKGRYRASIKADPERVQEQKDRQKCADKAYREK